MDEEGYSVLGQAGLLLRRILPLGIVILVTVSIGILLTLFISWLGEVLLQIPLQDSVSAFIQTGVLLSVAFALLGPLLSEKVLSSLVLVQSKTQQKAEVELVPQMDLRVNEPKKEKPHKPGVFERFREWLEAEEKGRRHETQRWEELEPSIRTTESGPHTPPPRTNFVQKRPEITSAAKPRELFSRENEFLIPSAMPSEGRSVELLKPNDSKNVTPETPKVQVNTPLPPQRLEVRIDEMSFTCSFCGKTTSLPWVKVQESQKGEKTTVDCQQCHNQYPFNYDLARGKLLSGKICAV